MHISSLGDMAQSFAMQTRNAALKQDMQRLTQELTSGQIADVRAAVGSNTAYINDLERSLTKLGGYELATLEASQYATGVQGTLEDISTMNSQFLGTMLSSTNSAFGGGTTTIIAQSRDTLEDVTNAMNRSVGGRTLFAGTATDTAPIVNPGDLLAALTTAIAGAGSVDDILAAADQWFDDPAGFATQGYAGSTTSLAPFALSEEDNARFELRGDDPVLRETLRNLALVALADDPALGLTQSQQVELFQKSTDRMLSTNDAVINLQGAVGFSESRLESISVRQSAERTTLEMARSDLLSADPYQTATELEQVQFQLQSLYAITSRMSQLSLVNFL